jgi:3-oxoacyl-[acyl-carrier protein] reductase
MKIDLSGMNVAVTGASRGIGRAIVQALASAGARVGVHYNRNEKAARELAREVGSGAQIFRADLSTVPECFKLFNEVEAAFGTIHAWVNNAGIALKSPLAMQSETWQANWQQTLMVNLTAVGLLCRSAIRHFCDHGGGRIINIASRAAFRGDTPEYLAYAASKGGIVALTRSIARGYGKENIKAFIIAPGFVRTDMAREFFDEYGEEFALDDIALPRLTEPEDVGPVVALLCSGLADHATGATIDINAGSYVH